MKQMIKVVNIYIYR